MLQKAVSILAKRTSENSVVALAIQTLWVDTMVYCFLLADDTKPPLDPVLIDFLLLHLRIDVGGGDC